MRAASTAAFFALSTPTVATGTPGRHLHDREQRVEPVEHRHRRAQRHADHRKLGVRGDDPGQRGGEAGAADQHLQPAAGSRTSRTRRRRRASDGPSAPRTPRRSRARRARRAPPASARGPTPSRRGSRPSGSAIDRRRDVAPEADAFERDELDGRDTRGRARSATVSAVAVTERILPPFVTTRPSRTAVPPLEHERAVRLGRRRGRRSATPA